MLALPKWEDKENNHQTTERRILRKIYGIIKENCFLFVFGATAPSGTGPPLSGGF